MYNKNIKTCSNILKNMSNKHPLILYIKYQKQQNLTDIKKILLTKENISIKIKIFTLNNVYFCAINQF